MIDARHFYHPSPAQYLFLKAYIEVKNPKFGPFKPLLTDFEGLRNGKAKVTTTPPFLEQKIKQGIIFYEKN